MSRFGTKRTSRYSGYERRLPLTRCVLISEQALIGESLIECLEMALIGGDTRPPPYRAFSARHDVYRFL